MDPIGRIKRNADDTPRLGPEIEPFALVEATGTVGPWTIGTIACGLCGAHDMAVVTLTTTLSDLAKLALECPSCGQPEARFELLEDPKF